MSLSVGDRLPETTFFVLGSDGVQSRPSTEIFAGRKVVLFGVPGAFTPTCQKYHLPGYLEHYDEILARGVDEIAVISVNDPHVMNAWAEHTGGKGRITFLSDGNAEFARACGLDFDRAVSGMGTRVKRFSMIVEDGVITMLEVEDAPQNHAASGAARMLEAL